MTEVLYSENFDQKAAVTVAYSDYKNTLPDWIINNRNNTNPTIKIEQGEAGNFLSINNGTSMGASRNGYCNFGLKDNQLTKGWRLTFRAVITPGDNQASQSIGILAKETLPTATGANPETSIFMLANSTAKSTDYAVSIGGTALAQTVTLASGQWYDFTIEAAEDGLVTCTVSDGTTELFSQQATLDFATLGQLYGLYYLNARYSGTTRFDDILLMGYEAEEAEEAFKGVQAWTEDLLTLTTNHITKSNTMLSYTTNEHTFQNGETYYTLTNATYYTMNLPEVIGVNVPNATGNWVLRYQGAGRSDRSGLYWTGGTDATLAIDQLKAGQWVRIVTLYTEPIDLVGLEKQSQWCETSLSAQSETFYDNIYQVTADGTATMTIPTAETSAGYVRSISVYNAEAVNTPTVSVTPTEGRQGYVAWQNRSGWRMHTSGGVSVYIMLPKDNGKATLSEPVDGIIPIGATVLLQRIDGKEEPFSLTATYAVPLASTVYATQMLQSESDEWWNWLADSEDDEPDPSAVMALTWNDTPIGIDLSAFKWNHAEGVNTLQDYIYYKTISQPTTVNYHTQFTYIPSATGDATATLYLSNSNHNKADQVPTEKFFGIRTGAYGDMRLLRVTNSGQAETTLGAFAITQGGTLQYDVYGYVNGDTKYTVVRLTDVTTGNEYQEVIDQYYVPKSIAVALTAGAAIEMQSLKHWSEAMQMPATMAFAPQNRGLYATLTKAADATFVSWRARNIDNENTQYRLYRNGELYGTYTDRTNATVACTDTKDKYRLEVVQDGNITETMQLDSVRSNTWFVIPLDRPVNTRTDCSTITVSQKVNPLLFPNDASAYDMDGDLFDEWHDNSHIDKWDDTDNSFHRMETFTNYPILGFTCNSTKATPCLQADLLGDWREEVVLWGYQADDTPCLIIHSTTIPTAYKLPWLRDDHVYDMSVVWQNVGYNQPPHLSYSPAERFGFYDQQEVPTGIDLTPALSKGEGVICDL